MRRASLIYPLLAALLMSACAARPASPMPTAAQTQPAATQSTLSTPDGLSSPTPSAQTDAQATAAPIGSQALPQTAQAEPTEEPRPAKTIKIESNEAMQEEKKALQVIAKELEALTPGVDYAENRVMALVSDRVTAQAVAEQYHMKLSRFEDGLAVYETTEPVLLMLRRASDTDNDLYPIYPDYLRSLS